MLFARLKNNWLFFVALIISIAILWLFERSPFFSSNYEIVALRILEVDRCFQDNQIPCRWVQNVVGFYGSPFFNYHAPLPYYFGEMVFKITSNLYFSVKSVFVFAFLALFVVTYFLTRKIWNKKIAILLSAFGSFTLYFWLNIAIIEPVGKIWSLVFFVAAIYCISRLKKVIDFKNILFFTIIVSFLLISHQRSFILFLPLLGAFIFIQFTKIRQIKFLIACVFAICLGLLLSSFYLVPMLFERSLIHPNYLPISTTEKIPQAPLSRYEILTGDSSISDFQEGSNWINLKMETRSHTILRLSQYYFPEWKIFVDNKEILFDYKNNSLGLMTIILGKGSHTIEARLYDTPIRSLANMLSLAGIGIVVFLFFISSVRVRKWILYYRKGIN